MYSTCQTLSKITESQKLALKIQMSSLQEIVQQYIKVLSENAENVLRTVAGGITPKLLCF